MEQRSFFYRGHEIAFLLDRGNRKHAYLSIDNEGSCVLKVPARASETMIHALLEQKAGWILKKTAQVQKQSKPPLEYRSGEALPVWGTLLRLNIITDAAGRAETEADSGKLLVYTKDPSTQAVRQCVKSFYYQETGRRTAELLLYWENQTGLKAAECRIKWLRRSWGRCRGDGGISINALLAAYPVECLSYVILHEVCHLMHMNHSEAFWALVSSHMPEYKTRQNELKISMDYLKL